MDKEQLIEKVKMFLDENLEKYDEGIGWTKEEFINNMCEYLNG